MSGHHERAFHETAGAPTPVLDSRLSPDFDNGPLPALYVKRKRVRQFEHFAANPAKD